MQPSKKYAQIIGHTLFNKMMEEPGAETDASLDHVLRKTVYLNLILTLQIIPHLKNLEGLLDFKTKQSPLNFFFVAYLRIWL